jgi:hypothetical protein
MIFFLWRCNPTRVMTSSFLRFLDHTQRRTTVGMTPLDGWSARRRTSAWQHTTFTTDRHPCLRWDFEPTISAGERPQKYALDRAATGTGCVWLYNFIILRYIYLSYKTRRGWLALKKTCSMFWTIKDLMCCLKNMQVGLRGCNGLYLYFYLYLSIYSSQMDVWH